jgi:hypothetical protein
MSRPRKRQRIKTWPMIRKCVIKMNGAVKVPLQSFWTLALYGRNWKDSCPCRHIVCKRTVGINWRETWPFRNLQWGSNPEKILSLCRQSNTNCPIIQTAVQSLSIPSPGVRNYQIHFHCPRNDASLLLSFPAHKFSTPVAPTLLSLVNTILFAIPMCYNNLSSISTFYWQLARYLVFARATSSRTLHITKTCNISVWYVPYPVH